MVVGLGLTICVQSPITTSALTPSWASGCSRWSACTPRCSAPTSARASPACSPRSPHRPTSSATLQVAYAHLFFNPGIFIWYGIWPLLHPHQCRQVPGQHHGQVPLVRPRVPRRALLRPGHLHGLLARGRRAADRAHHAVRPRRPLRGRRRRDAEALPREAAAQAANVGVAARAAALAAPVRRARLPAAGPRLHLLQDRQVKNRRAQERPGRAAPSNSELAIAAERM